MKTCPMANKTTCDKKACAWWIEEENRCAIVKLADGVWEVACSIEMSDLMRMKG